MIRTGSAAISTETVLFTLQNFEHFLFDGIDLSVTVVQNDCIYLCTESEWSLFGDARSYGLVNQIVTHVFNKARPLKQFFI
jgi:hypothetical protein